MTVTINSVIYSDIIDTEFDEEDKVSLPEWVNDATPDVDTTIWSVDAFVIRYTMRVTHAQKYVLDQLLTGHSSVTMSDTDYGLSSITVVATHIIATYKAKENWSKPWVIEFKLVQVQ